MIPLVVALAAAQAPAQAAAEPARPRLPYSIEFARTQIGSWQAEASSLVEDRAGVPMRGSVSCEIRRAGMQVRTWRVGQLTVHFGGYYLTGDQLELSAGSAEVRRIELDDSAWEYRWLGRWRKDDQFVDLRYPPPPPKYPPGWDIIHNPIMDVLQGLPAVRRGPGSPWFTADVLGNALLRAKRIRIGYVEDDRDPLPDEGPLRWAEFSLEGLRDALAWCKAAMNGERGRLFRADLDPKAAIAALLAAATPTAAPELPVAQGRVGPWRMSVATYVDQSETPPTIAAIRCSIRRQGFSLVLTRHGRIDLLFGGDGTGFSIAGIRAVSIGEVRWEARSLPLPGPERYADVDYPPGHPTSVAAADSYLGVRRGEGEPWLHLASLVDELAEAEARTLTVEHERGTYRLSLSGLPEALRWCTSTMQSDRARRFQRR